MGNYRLPGPTCSQKPSWFGPQVPLPGRSLALPGPLLNPSLLYPRIKRPRSIDLSFLFRQCRTPIMGITEIDYEAAATKLRVEVAAIKAVAEVETVGRAFDDQGRPTILFERHHFHRHTRGKFDSHASISNATAGGYGKFSLQYSKLEEAYSLDEEAALKSASWGRFQIMGSNHRASGFKSVFDFVLAMTKSETEHLRAFVNFVSSNRKRSVALQNKDWASFAKMYNGAGYKSKGYDVHMKDAYDRLTAPVAPGTP